MTFLEVRSALKAALSTVDGVTGYGSMPGAPKVGDAWVLMGRAERARGDAFTVAWRTRVCVPMDEEKALELFEGWWPPLFYALGRVGAEVDAFLPVIVPTKVGDIWAYEIICRTGE